MRTMLCVLAVVLGGRPLQAGIVKHYPGGYVLCIFDRPATISNQGSKLVVVVQDPATNRWESLPGKNSSPALPWSREFVDTDSSTDEVDNGGTLTIKKPVAVCFCNFKGGEVEVEFSVLPKRIKNLRKTARNSLKNPTGR